jgi:hypothetical protein
LNVNALTWLALQIGNEPYRSALCMLHGWVTINQLMAVFDWLTPAMVKIYTDKADRKRMSGQAMALLSEKRRHFPDNAECPTGPSGGVPPTPST